MINSMLIIFSKWNVKVNEEGISNKLQILIKLIDFNVLNPFNSLEGGKNHMIKLIITMFFFSLKLLKELIKQKLPKRI